jgi:peroxin-5
MALGILNFIERNYEGASNCFAAAIRENPTDHTLWNKFGACMSNNMCIPQAIEAYQQALDLRPNYVRTMVNLGLAHNRLNDLKSAVNCFLNVLVLNPNVSHVWTYLRTAVIKMNRMDMLDKLEMRDPFMFKDEFKLIDPRKMPQPTMDSLYTHDILN